MGGIDPAYGADVALLRRMLSSPQRTLRPEEAGFFLPYISPVSPLCLPCISPVSPLYLPMSPYISLQADFFFVL